MSFVSSGIPPSTSFFPLSPIYSVDSRRAALPPSRIDLPKLPPLTHGIAFLGSGLRTPPVDEMSTAFQPALASYDSHAMHSYPAAAPQAARSKMAAMNDSRNAQYYQYPVQQQPQQSQQLQPLAVPQVFQAPSIVQPSVSSVSSVTQPQSGLVSRQTTNPSSPSSGTITSSQREGSTSRRGSETLIYHSLQIPKCISPAGGNLADFAAQMTCLFWFESVDELKQAESIRSRPSNAPIPRLPVLAKPYDQFRKWVYNVLATTQVTQNVILLALLFIYRLKMSTPQIKGRAGSEFRLLTVALMLGNKFLDDNTYTNKTWAEVSSFNVQEIHVMEVEFLSNMRYNLVATKDQWEEWLDKLACFHEYYERALRLPTESVHSPIPSPTGTMHPIVNLPINLPITPTITSNFSPSSSHSQNWNAYQTNTVSPLATKPTVQFPITRKRSPEGDAIDHPAKRPAPSRAPPVNVVPMRSNTAIEQSRLPVPHLTLVTEQSQPVQTAFTNGNGYTQASQQVPTPQGHASLPPLQPGVRAMSTVYQPTPTTLVQQPPLPVTTATLGPVGYATHAPVNFNTPSKHHSPANINHFNSSPLTEHYGQASTAPAPMAHTPISNSPSVYLQQRPSPYKPVRHVNTLLYPPPSASLDQYHLSVPVPPTQMHYQPLGRRNDLRTGIVPEFIVYNRGQQQHQQHLNQPQHPNQPRHPNQQHHSGQQLHQQLPSQLIPQGRYPS
ncbi:hypothetical protein AK830_g11548 [Neonectria ditissima]|uniref:Meiotically up-regulated gene 80 protein n=1 Tax=Neonectria ditissima TaxID=78410 RepID=A0A0P7B2Z5_9HYPO|nr:hypothetical protein AK830_g11548 [Neonectria ditissima]